MAKRRSAKHTNAIPSPEASFVFRGTVQRVKDSTVSDIKPDVNTSVVRVDEVMAAPPALAHAAGREITVVTESGTTIKPGQQATFRASSLSFGQEVAVRARSVEPAAIGAPTGGMNAARAAAAPLAAAHTAAVDPVQAHRDIQLKRSLDEADVVVTGTVSAVRVAPETAAVATPAVASAAVRSAGRRGVRDVRAAAMATSDLAMAAAPTRISEHDPIWHEAVVDVESVEKGQAPRKQVVVRFPGSNDVRWRNHPKFKPGQQGVFLLSAPEAAGMRVAKATSLGRGRGARATATAVPVAAVGGAPMRATIAAQPISAIEKVRQLLKTSATAAPARQARTGSRRRRASKK